MHMPEEKRSRSVWAHDVLLFAIFIIPRNYTSSGLTY